MIKQNRQKNTRLLEETELNIEQACQGELDKLRLRYERAEERLRKRAQIQRSRARDAHYLQDIQLGREERRVKKSISSEGVVRKLMKHLNSQFGYMFDIHSVPIVGGGRWLENYIQWLMVKLCRRRSWSIY